MEFEFSLNEDLPPLAWCGYLKQGHKTLIVEHGRWVESFQDRFIAGAWNGDFESPTFDSATGMIGTGAVAGEHFVEVHASTNAQDPVYIHINDDKLWISNSLTFLMHASGRSPDPGTRYYHRIYVQMDALGIYRRNRTLPLDHGLATTFEGSAIRISPQFDIRQIQKPAQNLESDFGHYRDLLTEHVAAVVENAAHPNRRHRFGAIAQVSKGYDSSAIMGVCAAAGVRRSLSYYTKGEDGEPDHSDDGSTNARYAGLDGGQRLRTRLQSSPDNRFPEAPFCLVPPGFDAPLGNLADDLAGNIRITGSYGDYMLEADESKLLPDLKRPRHFGTTGELCSYEFRLGIGCLNFPPLFMGWQNKQKLFSLTHSDEMKPWWVEGDYNRPIARRLAVESGIPNDAIPKTKFYTQYHWQLDDSFMCAQSRNDYRALAIELGASALAFELKIRRPGAYLPFLFHWGVHHTLPRYAKSTFGSPV